MSKSPTSLLKDHDVRLAIYRLLLVLSSGFERQTKRTIALSKILVRKNITTPDEIDAIEKEFAAFVAVETALDPKLVERIKRARARELRPKSAPKAKRRRKIGARMANRGSDTGRRDKVFIDDLVGSGIVSLTLSLESRNDVPVWSSGGTFYDLQPTPEPATLLLMGTSAAGLGLARWIKRRRP